jgi:serine/threonine protein phosphatase PrpC
MSSTGRILPRFDYRVEIASDSVTGKVRPSNQDSVLVSPELALFAVADGMGGLAQGDVASKLAIETVKARIASRAVQHAIEGFARNPTLDNRRDVFDEVRAACEQAHQRVVQEEEKIGSPMGSTLDLCVLVRGKAIVAHVGDSRAYLVRPRALLQLTEDHLARDPASTRLAPQTRNKPRSESTYSRSICAKGIASSSRRTAPTARMTTKPP